MAIAPPHPTRFRLAVLVAATAAAAGVWTCGPDDPVVADVAGEAITASQLRAFVGQLPEGLKSPYEGDAARRHYLQSLVDRRLMLREARDRGLDTTRAVRGAADEATRSWLTTLYQRSSVMPRVQVDSAEVRRLVHERGFDRERKLNAILVHTRAEIDAVVAGLAAGTSFEDLARQHSLDQRSATQGGTLGFIDVDAAARLYVPAEVFRDLPLGQVSAPLPAGASWHVVRFVEDRPADLNRARNRVEEELFATGLQRAEEEEVERLQSRFAVVLDDDALQRLVDAYQLRNTASLDSDMAPLYRFDGGQVAVAEAQRVLRRGTPAEAMQFRDGAVATLRGRVLMPRLYAHAAVVDGLVDADALETHRRRLTEDMLLESLRQQESDRIDVSEIEARQFYDDHPEQFVHESSVWAEELLLGTEAEAMQARRLIEGGKDFAELASRSLRAGAAEHGARHHYHPREVALYPRLIPALLAAPRGVLTGPVEVDGGWDVFRVIRNDEGGIEPFEAVARRARALLLRRRQQDALGAFLQHLRDTHGAAVTIHAEHLAEALPDEAL